MKKKFIFILIVLFTLSFAFISCSEPDGTPETPVTDPALHFTWESEALTVEFKNDNTFEVSKMVQGTYTATASDKNITITPKEYHGDYLNEKIPGEVAEHLTLESKWYSQTDIAKLFSDFLAGLDEEELEGLAELIGTSAGIGELFGKQSGIYEISADDKTLTLKGDLFNGGEGATVTLTKK